MIKNNNEKAVLLDVSAIMYRSFYAHLNLRTPNEPTGATFGFLNTLLGVLKEFDPKYIIGAFDVKRKTLERTKIYDKYKADRKPMPDDLAVQIKRIEELLDIFNIKKVKIEGHEADDVLGSYAHQLSQNGIETYVVTGDKDLSQILDENVNISLLGKGDGKSRFKTLRTPEDVVEQLGVLPEKIPNLFGLIGDASDGIPGVRKIGPKKAIPMLDKYGDLEGVYENIDKLTELPGIGKSLIKNLEEDKELAFLSRELAVIKTDLELNFKLEDMLYKKDLSKLIELSKELNFKTYIKRFTLEYEKTKADEEQILVEEVNLKESENTESIDVSVRDFEIEGLVDQIVKLLKAKNITPIEFEFINKEVNQELSKENTELLETTQEVIVEEIKEEKKSENIEEKKRIIIKDLDEVKKMVKRLAKEESVGVFTNENGIVFSTKSENSYVSFKPTSFINKAVAMKAITPLFEVETPFVVYGYKNLLNQGFDPKNIKCDMFIGNYLLTNHTKDEFENFALERDGEVFETLGEILKGKDAEEKENSKESKESKAKLKDLDLEDNFDFLIKRAEYILNSSDSMLEELKVEELSKIYELEMNLVKVLYKMEQEGILINRDHFKKYQEELAIKLDEIIPQIKEEVAKGIDHCLMMMELTEDEIRETLLTLGKLNYKKKKEFAEYSEKIENATLDELLKNEIVFNIASPKQLGIVLFQLMKLNKVKKDSVGVEVLEVLRDRDGETIAEKILEYRKLSKLQSTYVEALPKLADENDRIHTTFNQTGTATGRLSSSNPNLQNIPARTPEGIKIREGFVAKDGYKLLAIDYSQIELRVLTEMSKDATLKLAYEKDMDLHDLTARKLFSLTDEEEVNREKRSLAKIVNFSIIYGKTAFGLSSELKISLNEAKEYITRYFNQYPGVKALETQIIADAKVDGHVRTLYNRKRIIPGLNSSNKNLVKQAERMAVNSVIQGTAADILKIVMVELDKKLKDKEDIKMSLQVHDELIFEVKEDKIEEYATLIKEVMENTVQLEDVALKANVEMGKNWSEAK